MANIVPVRPKPVITSSAMRTTPWRSQMRLSAGQYSSDGTAAPAAEDTGSAITAATDDAP